MNSKCYICEISEEDFRKLDIKVYKQERVVLSDNIPEHPLCRFEFVEKNLNDILDDNINHWIDAGYEEHLEDLKCPVTIAIHIGNEDGGATDYYLDKFMNQFTGGQTYQLGMGIDHLYSTRDYFESHKDFWRVLKRETKVIYRVRLSEKTLNRFVLKHKRVISAKIGENHWIEDHFDLENGKWVLKNQVEVTKEENFTSYLPLHAGD